MGVVDDAMKSGRDLIDEFGVRAGPVQDADPQVDHVPRGLEDQLVIQPLTSGREPSTGCGLGSLQSRR